MNDLDTKTLALALESAFTAKKVFGVDATTEQIADLALAIYPLLLSRPTPQLNHRAISPALAPLFHLRRQLRQHAQELRRAQLAAAAAELAEMDAFAEQLAAEHAAFVARLPAQQRADQARLLSEAEASPDVLAALRSRLH